LNTGRRHPGKDDLFAALALPAKASSSPRRLELLDLLGQAPRTVEALAEQTSMSIANTSQHLQVLRAAGLVRAEKEGLYVTYRLASAAVVDLLAALRRVAEAHVDELAEAKRALLLDAADLTPVSGKDLLQRARSGEVVLLDVRPREEFASAHLPHALSVPIDELARRLDELPKATEIVAYCRGPYCVYAAQAVRLLRRRGFHASRLEDGVREWQARRLPLVTSEEHVS
jgi:rhodanese-related sulfurtransferase/DNA-binding transcriptional ArsR family regulator